MCPKKMGRPFFQETGAHFSEPGSHFRKPGHNFRKPGHIFTPAGCLASAGMLDHGIDKCLGGWDKDIELAET